jgi:protoheme IX farnesyltransferase
MRQGRQSMTWKTVPALTRTTLSLIVACSALTGFIYFRHAITGEVWFAFAGVFLMACAASALNQYQEREFDAIMERTKNRPLPLRQISGRAVLLLTVLIELAGISILYFGTTPLAALLGVLTLLWYNGVYTPLKRKTRYAVLIGAFTGALPPLIGYTAAGGGIISTCLVISLFMFLWQVSHFQLLLVKYGKEYEKAGFSAMTSSTDEKAVRISVFIWMAAAAGSALLLPLFGMIFKGSVLWLMVIACVLIVSYFLAFAVLTLKYFNFRTASYSMYLFQACIFSVLIAGSLAWPGSGTTIYPGNFELRRLVPSFER